MIFTPLNVPVFFIRIGNFVSIGIVSSNVLGYLGIGEISMEIRSYWNWKLQEFLIVELGTGIG